MESVEASTIDTQAAEQVTVSDEQELGAVWDRIERDNGAARSEDGKFTSTQSADDPPEEGGEGEAAAAAETSTQAVSVPLPSNWNGKDELWGKIPEDLREPIKVIQEEFHQKLSQMGRELSAVKPIGETVAKYSEYFDGRAGNYKPAEAIDYLFNLQRSMDKQPLETLIQIADTYKLRPVLAQMFSQTEGQQGNGEQVLLAKIGELESTIRSMADPSRIDQRISQKFEENRATSEAEGVFSRVSNDIPLANEVSQEDLVHFIGRAWAKLGDTASKEAVLRQAYDMAINADPDLRTRSAAHKSAAVTDASKVAAAKRATQVNVTSTSTGKTRDLTEDEELAQVWDKNQKG